MATIIPRWEWRTFGRRFPAADAVFDASQPSATVESDETYFLSPSGANVKLRDDLVDIKVLREVDGEGLERWEPVLKRPFPLTAEDLATTLDALGIAGAGGRGGATDVAGTSREAFQAILDASAVIRTVPVHKSRIRYTVNGCMAERSEVEAEGRRQVTIAVESTDRPAVVEAVAQLGLADYLNTNYGLGVAMLIEDAPERYGVIDAGTNSIKFHVGELDAEGSWRTVADRAEVTRLGEGVASDGAIGREALDRAIAAIAGMVEEARRDRVRAITAVGTEVLRQASNRDAVLDAIHARTGVRIQVLPGDEEGRMAYVAVKAGVGDVGGSLVVFDTGGGSSQFTFGDDDRVAEQFSVPVGAVRFAERFGLDGAVSPERIAEARAAIAADLGRIEGRPSPGTLVGMGGAITNMTAVMHGLSTYDPNVVQGSVLDAAEVDRQIERYRSQDAEARRSIVGLQPKRAEVILAGACIVRTVMDLLGKDRLIVSDRGLRHGVLVERFTGTRVHA
jgi:exopolyphosphatase/guanosine-5'-triphosphate,3'-diphosphate pyrophosphatase